MEHDHEDGYLSVYATVEIFTDESLAVGVPDERGWVNSIHEPAQIFENRNDVQPLFHHALPLGEDALNELDDMLSTHSWMARAEDGNLHATRAKDWVGDYVKTWQYSLHGYVRHYVDGVVQECQIDPRNPLREGVIRLMVADALEVDADDIVWAGDGWEIEGLDWQSWRDARLGD